MSLLPFLEVFMPSLPDYWSMISSQMSAFMNWSAVSTPVSIIVGAAVVTVMLGLFLSVFMRH